MNLPEDFVISKFYEYGHRVKYYRYNDSYVCACPICREGKSFHKKRRCFYIPKKSLIYCHNCGWSSRPYNWIKKVSGVSDAELIKEIQNCDFDIGVTWEDKVEENVVVPSLPEDCINLSDRQQIDYYSGDQMVQEAVKFIKTRHLDKACNKPRSFYFSLKDKVHRHRLIIPFFDVEGELEFYQSRKIFKFDQKEKYISKVGGERTIFNIDQVEPGVGHVFVFEGPIDACFVKSGIAVGGINEHKGLFSPLQEKQMNQLMFYEKIWVLDSQWLDKTSLIKSELLLKEGESVFIWPEHIGTRYKDFNETCVAQGLYEISSAFIKKNTFKGIEGVLKLAAIKQYVRT